MTVGDQARSILQAVEEAGVQDPDLSAYFEFHRRLFQVLDQAKMEISGTLERTDEGVLRTRLFQGRPLLSFAQLPIEAGRFAKVVSTVARVLQEYDSDLVKQVAPISPAECLDLARQRFEAGKAGGEQSGTQEEVTLAQASVDLALKPYLEWTAEQVLPHVDQGLWKKGYCPVCGGAPDFATLDAESGARHLLCSRCDSLWRYQRLGCPFCDTTDHTKIVYYPSEDSVYRLYVCQECRRYLKTIDLRETGRAVLLPVERITTVAMDVTAQQQGYQS